MVTPEKALLLFKKYNISKEFDFLSVDIDGNDYWVTKEILKEYRPAVISVEFNPNFPIGVSATLKNCNSNFVWIFPDKVYGASARAIYELGKSHGYSYVFHLYYTDIFMVRTDLLPQEYRGMRLEDTYDAFPIHIFDTALKIFSTVDILKEDNSDCK
jgi:hypothetical protein